VLNSGDEDEMTKLSTIGKKRAQQIIEYARTKRLDSVSFVAFVWRLYVFFLCLFFVGVIALLLMMMLLYLLLVYLLLCCVVLIDDEVVLR